MKTERATEAAVTPDALTPFETFLCATAAGGLISSLFLKEQAGKKAFWIGTSALVPFAYSMHKKEEAWHEQNPWVRESVPIQQSKSL